MKHANNQRFSYHPQFTRMSRNVLLFLFLAGLSCGRVTGTIDDPYYLLYKPSSGHTYLRFEGSTLRMASYTSPNPSETTFPITDSTKRAFSINSTAESIKGSFTRRKDKGCDGNPGGAYKEVVLYDLELAYYGTEVTTETYHGEAYCE